MPCWVLLFCFVAFTGVILGFAGLRVSAGDVKPSILIVDDNLIMREGIKKLIEAEGDLTVCGEVESPADALRAIERLQPDLAVVDLSLRESSGLELIKDIKVRFPRLTVLALSLRDETFYAERVLRAGAKGYLTSKDGPARLIQGIRKVLAGQIFISEQIASMMIRTLVTGGAEPGTSLVQNLTDRELQVFELIGHGLPTRAIAKALHLSVKTVESHREHIKEKLTLENSVELLKYAIQWVQMPRESDWAAPLPARARPGRGQLSPGGRQPTEELRSDAS